LATSTDIGEDLSDFGLFEGSYFDEIEQGDLAVELCRSGPFEVTVYFPF
jgi:hypothetical protein